MEQNQQHNKPNQYEPTALEQWELMSALNREQAEAPDVEQQWQLVSARLVMEKEDDNEYLKPLSPRTRIMPFVKWVAGIAAMVALVMGLKLWVEHAGVTTTSNEKAFDITATNDITEVTLTTADGKNHEVTRPGMTLRTSNDEKPAQMMALSTPRGKDYHLTLADGTQVWLNADSRLEFPETFRGDRREVKLKGEAYFEVTKDAKRPFVVVNDFFTTQVLGTAFNIKAYTLRDAAVTLVEGSVRVKAGDMVRQLTPGQQAALQHSQLQVRQVDTYPFVQWKEGFLYYENATLLTIMQDLARWYNVNVSFDDTSKMTLRLHFVVERDKPLAEAIKNLNSLGEVHAAIEGNVIAIN